MSVQEGFVGLVKDEEEGVTYEVHEIALPYKDIKAFRDSERMPRTISLGEVGHLAVFSNGNMQTYSGGLLTQGELLTPHGELKTSVNFFYPSLLERIVARTRSQQPEVKAAISITYC